MGRPSSFNALGMVDLIELCDVGDCRSWWVPPNDLDDPPFNQDWPASSGGKRAAAPDCLEYKFSPSSALSGVTDIHQQASHISLTWYSLALETTTTAMAFTMKNLLVILSGLSALATAVSILT